MESFFGETCKKRLAAWHRTPLLWLVLRPYLNHIIFLILLVSLRLQRTPTLVQSSYLMGNTDPRLLGIWALGHHTVFRGWLQPSAKVGQGSIKWCSVDLLRVSLILLQTHCPAAGGLLQIMWVLLLAGVLAKEVWSDRMAPMAYSSVGILTLSPGGGFGGKSWLERSGWLLCRLDSHGSGQLSTAMIQKEGTPNNI